MAKDHLLIGLRESFWFLPALLVLSSAALAVSLVELDARLPDAFFAELPRLFGAGAEGSRAVLSAIATSTITVAGVVFSIYIVALSLATAQYSPHVLQNFMRDRANQLVLGVFLGIYTYCLIVLRTVRSGDEAFVPGVSIVGGIALALMGVAFLIFFIHHISTSIQLSHITAQIAGETRKVIDRLYPDSCSSVPRSAPTRATGREQEAEVRSGKHTGYIQQINYDRLADIAARGGGSIRIVVVVVVVGEFVAPCQRLAELHGGQLSEEQDIDDRVRRAFAIGRHRNIDQDVSFGLQQLVDIACKALAPANDDTSMAVHALEHLNVLLCSLAGRELDGQRCRPRDGRIVVESVSPRFEDFLHMVVEPIGRRARDNPRVLLQLIETLRRVGGAAAALLRSRSENI